jgi:uncharacterized protein (DUF697 family)
VTGSDHERDGAGSNEGSAGAPGDETERRGKRLLFAVERLVDDSDTLAAQAEAYRSDFFSEADEDDAERLRAVAERIIASYSTRSAITGGVAAVPAMVPGPGTAVAVVGGSLADMILMLKHEVEMTLCLTHLYGHDIRQDKGRWLAYALAAVNTYEAKSGGSYLEDMTEAQLEALVKYTPRQLSKLAMTALGKLALLSLSKGLVRALPLVGVVVGASANKMLTTAVGRRCTAALARRREAEGRPEEPVVEASLR